MLHFKNIPTIEYSPSNIDETVTMKNLFFTLNLYIENENTLQLYLIDGDKRLDAISQELYGSTEHWWLLAKLNNINDIIFDLPLSEEVLQRVAEDRTLDPLQGGFTTLDDIAGSSSNDITVSAMEYYIEQFEELVVENDNKRQIQVIRPQYIGDILTEIIKNL